MTIDREAQKNPHAEETLRHPCASKDLVDCILMLIAAFAVSGIGVVLLVQGAGGIGTSLFAAFVSGGLVWMNLPLRESNGTGVCHLSLPLFATTNHVFVRALSCTVCMYSAAWEHGSRHLFVVSGIGFVALLLSALGACIGICIGFCLKLCRRSSPDQKEAETAEDVIAAAAQSALEKGHKEKIAKAKTAELKSVPQPEARAGDGDARSLSNFAVVISQALAFFQMLGMSLELQLKIPGLAMPPVVRFLAGVLPVFAFETFEMPIPPNAAVSMQILAPAVLLWSFLALEKIGEALPEEFRHQCVLGWQLVPFLLLLIISLALGETWGIVIGASCSALILFSHLVKMCLRRSSEKAEHGFDSKPFEARVLLLLYGASYLGPLRALTGLYMSGASTPASGWIGIVSGTVLAVLLTFIAILLFGGDPHFRESVGDKTFDRIQHLRKSNGAFWRYVIMLLFLSVLPFLCGLGAPVYFERALIAALGVVFVIVPLVVMYLWNSFNENDLQLEDPFRASCRFVAAVLPVERAAGMAIVELLMSQPDTQLILFFLAVTFFLSLLVVSKPYNEREDFFNDLALRCSVAVVAAVALDMRFGFGMSGPREAAAVGVSIAGVLWVVVALKPLHLPRAFVADIRRRTPFWLVKKLSKETSVKCPEGHKLSLFQTPEADWYCNRCNAAFPKGTLLYGCRTCEYDLCQSCINMLQDRDAKSEEDEKSEDNKV